MIEFTEDQLARIKSLKPLQDSKFEYNTDTWEKLDGLLKSEIQEFEGKFISREDVINCYKNYFDGKDNSYIKPFLLTMVWGFSNTGYGTYRTNKYLAPDNRNLIKEALQLIQENCIQNLEKSFNKLNSINGLGISFISKVLYFATRAKAIEQYQLIFDIRVAKALLILTTPYYKLVNILPSPKYKYYTCYHKLLHDTAAKYKDITAEQIEMFLFEMGGEKENKD